MKEPIKIKLSPETPKPKEPQKYRLLPLDKPEWNIYGQDNDDMYIEHCLDKTNKTLDKIIVVSSPLELRIERVMSRDKLSREEVIKRINSQMPQEEKEKMADFVLNNLSLQDLEREVLNLHHLIQDKYC